MNLHEAFAIIQRFRPELRLQPDHVCTDEYAHRLNGCQWSETAVYTEFDAKHRDTARNLHERLGRGDPLKPTS
jgi:hypothetical protein